MKILSAKDLWKVYRYEAEVERRILFETANFEEAQSFQTLQIEYEIACVAFYNGFAGDWNKMLSQTEFSAEDYLAAAESIFIGIYRPDEEIPVWTGR